MENSTSTVPTTFNGIGVTILKTEDINSARAAITSYVETCKQLFTSLETEINNLTGTGSDFNGASADGYNVFFTQTIKPALTTNLTDGETSLMEGLKSMLTSIENALLEQLDPQLGTANQNAGSEATDAVAGVDGGNVTTVS